VRIIAAGSFDLGAIVYFVESGVASILTSMANGATIEVGIGREGIAAALLGGAVSAQQIIVQVPGAGHRMPAAKCRAAFAQSPAFRSAVLGYVAALLDLGAQTAACNRVHSIDPWRRGADLGGAVAHLGRHAWASKQLLGIAGKPHSARSGRGFWRTKPERKPSRRGQAE